LSKSSANLDPEVNDGQLCVKGRFCMPEVTHHFERAKWTMLQKGDYFRKVGWDEAIQKVAAELKGIRPDEFLMLASPDLTNESLFAAQKFVRECIGSNGIDSTARTELAGGLDLWSKLFSLPISIKSIARADVILAVGLDSRFNFSVVGTKVRKALDRGAKLVTIDARESNLARYTDDWLRPTPGKEGLPLKFLADGLAGRASDPSAVAKQAGVEIEALTRALKTLSAAKDLTVIAGPQAFHYSNTDDLAQSLSTLSQRPGTNFIPLYFGANTRGALEMGILQSPESKVQSPESGLSLADVLSGSKRPKVLYLVGEVPFLERPDCDFLIVQDTYLPPFKVDAFLPAASFAEAGGTVVNVEGRVQEIVPVESPTEGAVAGVMRPDWRIFSDLARALGFGGMNYQTYQDVDKDINAAVAGFPASADRMPRRMKAPTGDGRPKTEEPRTRNQEPGAFLLVAEPGGYRHRGVDISSKVGGLGELALEEGFRMSPEDFASLGLSDGDQVTVSLDDGAITVSGPAKSNRECPKGVVYYTRPVVFGGLSHRHALWPLYGLEQNPVPASVRKA